MRINPLKTSEMIIYVCNFFNSDFIPCLNVGTESIKRVVTFKLLGLIFRSDLSWSSHVSYMLFLNAFSLLVSLLDVAFLLRMW